MGCTVVGELTAVPLDPSLPTYTGRYTVRFSQRDNPTTDTAQFTNTINAQG